MVKRIKKLKVPVNTSIAINDICHTTNGFGEYVEIKGQEITVCPTTSFKAGGCNGCSSHIDKDGMTTHKVWNISVKGFSFRVCEACRKYLTEQLQKYS